MTGEFYTGFCAWDAEGARVAVVTCLRCGAALLLDPRDEEDPKTLHNAFHDHLDVLDDIERRLDKIEVWGF